MTPNLHRCNPRLHWWKPLREGQRHVCAEHGASWEVQRAPVMVRSRPGLYKLAYTLRWVETTKR